MVLGLLCERAISCFRKHIGMQEIACVFSFTSTHEVCENSDATRPRMLREENVIDSEIASTSKSLAFLRIEKPGLNRDLWTVQDHCCDQIRLSNFHLCNVVIGLISNQISPLDLL